MTTVRVLTLNLWQEQGPWEKRLAYCATQIKALSPDVICLQEVRQVEGRVPNQAHTLATALGYNWYYESAQAWGGGDEGLAILTRHPIVARDCVELPHPPQRERRLGLGISVQIESATIWFFTTHLAYRLEDGLVREQQVLALDRFVQSKGPFSATAAVLTGDFNATPDSDEIRYLRGLTSLNGQRRYYQDAWMVCANGQERATWAKENPYTQPLKWLMPGRRLDYIFVTPLRSTGVGEIENCQIVFDKPSDDGVYCSDHYGVVAQVRVI